MKQTKFVIQISLSSYLAKAATEDHHMEVTQSIFDALRFDDYEDARDLATCIGASWVVGVGHYENLDLSTAEGRISARDMATEAFDEVRNPDHFDVRESTSTNLSRCVENIEHLMRQMGFGVITEARGTDNDADPEPSNPLTVKLCDLKGNTITLEWDPMVDGFEYEISGDDADELTNGPDAVAVDPMQLEAEEIPLTDAQMIAKLIARVEELELIIDGLIEYNAEGEQ